MTKKQANKVLKRSLKGINKENEIELVRFDLFEEFNNLLNDAEDFNFTNITDACFSSITFTFNPGCNFGANFSTYIFFDETHPTTRAHKIIGDIIAEEIE